MRRKFKYDVIDLSQDNSVTGFEFDMALKTVNHAEFFQLVNVRQLIFDVLQSQAIKYRAKLSNVDVYTYGVSFHVMLPTNINPSRFLSLTAGLIIRTVDKKHPELNLSATLNINQPLSRLWHRPYYLKSVTPLNYQSFSDYFE